MHRGWGVPPLLREGDRHTRASRVTRGLSALTVLLAIVLMPAVVMADDFSGGAGDDTHDHANATDDTIEGGGGEDTLDGSGGNDTVIGDDQVDGGGGDAQLDGADDDLVSGGDGNDGNSAQLGAGVLGDGTAHSNGGTATVNGGDDTVDGGDGNDQQVLGDGQASSTNTAELNGGDDSVSGGDGDDLWVHGDGLADCIGCTAIIAVLNGGDDTVHGGSGNDTQVWGDGYTEGSSTSTLVGGIDSVFGDSGNDPSVMGDGFAFGNLTAVLIGGNDTVVDGGADGDAVYGDGATRVDGTIGLSALLTGGADTVLGGDGTDSVVGDGIVTVVGATGDGTLVGAADTINGGTGSDTAQGDGVIDNHTASGESVLTGGDDVITGAGGNGDGFIRNHVGAGTVNATLNGGNDTMTGEDDADTLYGDGQIHNAGSGLSRLNGGDDEIDGGSGGDKIIGDGWINDSPLTALLTGGDDILRGGDGNDTLWGDSGNEVLRQNVAAGDDQLFGDAGDDTLIGDLDNGDLTEESTGSDTLVGGIGSDTIFGDGRDYTSGIKSAFSTDSRDVIYGDNTDGTGDGDDTIWGDSDICCGMEAYLFGGEDEIHGGGGNDLIFGDGYADAGDQLEGPGTIAELHGAVDVIFGDAGNDTIFGQSGNDVLLGGDGDDVLDGGIGNDFLCGGSGTNTVKGGAGADLQCAVDDAITVTERGGTINVAINEELDDADDADRAGRRFEIVAISGDIKAVIDTKTGKLTIFEAGSDGQIQYRVWLIDGGFESFGTVFVALARTQEEEPPPEEEEPETQPQEAPVILPVIDPVAPVDPTDPLAPAPPTSPNQDVTTPTSDQISPEDIPPALDDPTHKSESIQEFLRGPLAPAVTAGVTGTVMMAVTGGAGVAAGGLASGAGSSGGGAAARGERQTGRARARSGGGSSASRYEGTVERYTLLTVSGIGIGDRSRTWRLIPGRRLLDKASSKLPAVFAPHSPLLARLAVDGAHLRAMFGALWVVAPALGAILGALATYESGGRPISPPLWMLIAGAVLTTLDAFSGAVAAAVYITAGIVTGALIDDQPPDLVHSLLVYCGVTFLWTSIPLIGSALRPFRRLGKGDFRYAWDVVADLAIASLLCAWITRSLMSAMDSFAGTDTGLPAYANTVALVVLACVAARIVIEHITTRLYPLRLQSVEALGELPAPTLLASLSGIAIRTALFAFIGYSFIGMSWHWWAGVALYVVPQVFSALGTEFDRVDALNSFIPRGITALFVLLLVAAVVVHIASSRTSSDLETMRWVFMLLALPPAVLAVLEAFAPESENETTWTREFLGLGVVVGSAYLAFNGWNL